MIYLMPSLWDKGEKLKWFTTSKGRNESETVWTVMLIDCGIKKGNTPREETEIRSERGDRRISVACGLPEKAHTMTWDCPTRWW